MNKKTGAFILAVLMAGMLAACGQNEDAKTGEEGIVENDSAGEQKNEDADSESKEEDLPTAEDDTGETSTAEDAAGGTSITEKDTDETAQSDEWKQQFGENCIAEQTFEVELSEYRGKVVFVPYMPSADEENFHMQIVQDGKVLSEVQGYVPRELSGETFKSLDAVSFYDINYDGNTDILLIETYGATGFAAVYYGYMDILEGQKAYFTSQEELSENITGQAEALTVPAIRELLSAGKKNGEFSGYQEAYEAAGRLSDLESSGMRTYGLIYVDEDETPELAAGLAGYYTCLYTFHDGKIYTLMDHWAYGAMGNAGYEYAPRKNNIRNCNSDYAGAILYTTYMEISGSYTLDIKAEIKTVNFDDVNGNGMPDEEEMDSLGLYGADYMDGKEISSQEWKVFDAGEYEMITGTMSLEELQAAL